jgi:hypothetical protein
MTIETHRFCTTRRTTPYDLCRSRLPSRPAAIQQKWSRFFLTLCNYAFSETYLCPTVTQPALPLWHSSDDAFGPGPSSYNESFDSYAGLAQAYSQDPHEAFLTDQVFQSKATCVEHGQHPINQNWISVIGGPLQDDVFFGSDTREADTPNGLLGKVSGSLGPTVVNHDDQAEPRYAGVSSRRTCADNVPWRPAADTPRTGRSSHAERRRCFLLLPGWLRCRLRSHW